MPNYGSIDFFVKRLWASNLNCFSLESGHFVVAKAIRFMPLMGLGLFNQRHD